MARLSFNIQGMIFDLDVGFDISDQDASRIINYLLNSHYGKVAEEIDGKTIKRDATPAEAAEGFARGILRGLLNQVVRYEQEEASKIAKAQIEEIQING